MPTYQWLIGEFIPAISRTLLHSLWQAILAALIAGLIIVCTRKARAAIRYNALLSLFGLLITTVAITFFIELQSTSETEPAAPVASGIGDVIIGTSNSSYQTGRSNFISIVLAFADKYSVLLVSTWFLFFIFQLTRMAFGLREISYIKNRRNQAPPDVWKKWIQEKSKELGIQQSVMLWQSELAKIPLAIGYFKPVVLVPLGLLTHLSPAQAETVLLHELAHIKRRDYLVNLVQSFVDAIFFFNPAFVWLSSLIRQEREKCCDDMVIKHTNNQQTYLEALVSFQEMNLSSSYAMAIGTRKYYLLNRVKRILTRKNSRLSMKETASLAIGVLMLAIVFMAFRPIIPSQKSAAPPTKYEVVDQIQPKVSAAPLVSDTLPKKSKESGERPLRFKKIITNIVDDGESNTFQVQATEENGTVYKFRKKENQITGFSINDKEIPKSEYDKYSVVLDAIERARKKHLRHAMDGDYEPPNELVLHLDTANVKLFDLKLDSLSLFNESLVNINDSFMHNEVLFNTDLQPGSLFYTQDDHSFSQNPVIANIISDLMANKLIESEKNVSFTLTNTEFTVNGKSQGKAIHEKFKAKYLKHPADRYKYSRQGSSTKTEIYTN